MDGEEAVVGGDDAAAAVEDVEGFLPDEYVSPELVE